MSRLEYTSYCHLKTLRSVERKDVFFAFFHIFVGLIKSFDPAYIICEIELDCIGVSMLSSEPLQVQKVLESETMSTSTITQVEKVSAQNEKMFTATEMTESQPAITSFAPAPAPAVATSTESPKSLGGVASPANNITTEEMSPASGANLPLVSAAVIPPVPLESKKSPKLVSIADSLVRKKPQEVPSPTCQNCQTNTTPLWRRDESGQVLCNACGLFLKLHGRPRPISLKTDVIKSRNRIRNLPNTAVHGLKSQEPTIGGDVDLNDPNNSHRKSKGRKAGHNSSSSSSSSPSLNPKDTFPHLPPISPMDHYVSRPNYWPVQYGHHPQVYGETGYSHVPFINLPNGPIGPNGAPLLAASGYVSDSNGHQHQQLHQQGQQHPEKPRSGTTVLDQLSAAASASPYLQPHQPESDTRLPPLQPKERPSINGGAGSDTENSNQSNSPSNEKPDGSDYQALKSRVTELELVNDLYRSRISELEKAEATIRQSELSLRSSYNHLEKKNQTLNKRIEELQAQIKSLAERDSPDDDDDDDEAEYAAIKDLKNSKKSSQWSVVNKSVPKTRKKLRVSDIL